MSERACFFCMNSHNAGLACDCACHKFADLWDKLKAIDKEIEWTYPQLSTIQKLMEQERKP